MIALNKDNFIGNFGIYDGCISPPGSVLPRLGNMGRRLKLVSLVSVRRLSGLSSMGLDALRDQSVMALVLTATLLSICSDFCS